MYGAVQAFYLWNDTSWYLVSFLVWVNITIYLFPLSLFLNIFVAKISNSQQTRKQRFADFCTSFQQNVFLNYEHMIIVFDNIIFEY